MSDSLDPRVKKFLARLEKLGGRERNVGNISLRRELRWNDDTYWEIRDKAYNLGRIGTARGKGGSVFILDDTSAQDDDPSGPPENYLYEPIRQTLERSWIPSQSFDTDRSFAQRTDKPNFRVGRDAWTLPDITVIGRQHLQYLRQDFLEIITFEVKVGFDIKGVYEAVANGVGANRTYLILYITKEDQETFDRIKEASIKQGIGLIKICGDVENYAEAVQNYSDWKFVIEADDRNPSPIAMEEFLKYHIFKKSLEDFLKAKSEDKSDNGDDD